jgi:FtsP/CotA-like multicopper oxidase with cupredoxin domain
MGERYDVLVTLGDGVFPLVAVAEGKKDAALALVRTAGGQAPPASTRPAELDGRIVTYPQLAATDPVRVPARAADRTIRLELTGGMMAYDWAFNGRPFDHAHPTRHASVVRAGERVRVDFVNATMMFHPVHLHGHTFAIGEPRGPRKDTAIVLPGRTLATYFDADNPGLWAVHCHNAYHAESGMMTLIGYERGGSGWVRDPPWCRDTACRSPTVSGRGRRPGRPRSSRVASTSSTSAVVNASPNA